jgi:hypothetical protein
MVSRPRSSIRQCPVCGIAMQASKSRENLGDFDTFSCLSCDTMIVLAKSQPNAGGSGKK